MNIQSERLKRFCYHRYSVLWTNMKLRYANKCEGFERFMLLKHLLIDVLVHIYNCLYTLHLYINSFLILLRASSFS